jgi:large repetitive protein
MTHSRWFRASVVAAIVVILVLAFVLVIVNTGGGASRPGAPRSVHAVAGNASATVTWTDPASNGGGAITSFRVTSHPAGRTCRTAAMRCTVKGLANGTSYTFTVAATNAAGTGPDSPASNAVAPGSSSTPSSPRLMVTPSTGLSSGQRVTVSGSGFKPGDQVYLVECLAHPTGANSCDVASATPVTITAQGTLPPTQFTLVTGTVGGGTCGTTSSNLDACAVSAGNASGGDSAVEPIGFKAPASG